MKSSERPVYPHVHGEKPAKRMKIPKKATASDVLRAFEDAEYPCSADIKDCIMAKIEDHEDILVYILAWMKKYEQAHDTKTPRTD